MHFNRVILLVKVITFGELSCSTRKGHPNDSDLQMHNNEKLKRNKNMKNASTPLLSFFGQTKFGLRLPVLYMAIYDSPPLCRDDSSLSRSVCT